MKRKLLFGLVLALMGVVNSVSADELTVYDGTATNQYIPVYGYYADAYQKTEFIMPAEDLQAMNGASITGLKFYANSATASWGNAVFQIFVKEVDATQLTTFLGTEGATTVYTGSLSVSSSNMEITFSNEYTYNGGNLLIGIFETTKGAYQSISFYGTSQDGQTAWRGYSSTSLDAVTGSAQYFLPKMTFTYDLAVSGPGLKVKNYQNGDTFSFGMVNPGTAKTITLVNPGTEDITVNIATTGGFTANMTTATIAANKGEQVVTITAPETTSNGTITITPTVDDVDAIVLNLNCVVKDPNKVFVDFSDNVLPEGWETKGIGSYTTGDYASTYAWDFSNGYALYKSSSSSAGYLDYYYNSLVSPLMKFTEGETMLFKVKKEVSYSSYLGYVRVDYTVDGSTWTPAATFADADLTNEWTEKEATLPATAKQIRFVAAGVAIDDIYGGEYSTAPVMKVTASDYGFGMVNAEATTTFTIQNTGKSALTDITVESSDANFTIENAPASVDVDETATVTVKMSAANTGMHEGVITVSAPEQATVTFNVSGYVMDETLFTETFDGNALPAGWTTTGWTFANGEASGIYSSTRKQLITPALVVEAGEKMAVEVMKTRNSGCAMDIYVSKNGGDFAKHMTIADADLVNGTYNVFFIEGLEAGSYQIRFDANDNKINAVNGFHLDQNAPMVEMVSTEAAAFGKLTAAPEAKTYTVKNVGTGTLTVNIASDSEDFIVAPETLEIQGGESADFTITFNYVEGNYGTFAGNITVTPTYDESAKVTIAASARTVDPSVWEEDFENGDIPLGWDAANFAVGTKSYTTNPNTTLVAYVSSRPGTLVTPRLEAKAGDVLNWEAYCSWYDEGFKVEYSVDEKATWQVAQLEGLTMSTASSYENVYRPIENGYTNNERGVKLDMAFKAPADGIYYIRLTGTWGDCGVDNFYGFKLALKEHDANISEVNIRSTFTQYADHQVSVTVKELMGKEEEMTAKFFIDGTQYGEAVTETVPAGGEKEFVIAVRLNEVISGNAYFVVSNDNIELTSEAVAITTNPAIVLDETVAPESLPTGYQDKVAVKYTAKQGWNTICLPFALTDEDLTALFGEGWKAYEFCSYNNGELGFRLASRRYAGYPYIVYCESVPTIEEPGYLVTYVSFSSEKSDQYGGAIFQGTFSPIAAPDMEGIYGVTPDGRIMKGSANASMKGYRAYFDLPTDAGTSKLVITVDGETVATGIDAMEMLNELNGDIYDLQGRKVNHAQKGVFIQNGKKVLVK